MCFLYLKLLLNHIFTIIFKFMNVLHELFNINPYLQCSSLLCALPCRVWILAQVLSEILCGSLTPSETLGLVGSRGYVLKFGALIV